MGVVTGPPRELFPLPCLCEEPAPRGVLSRGTRQCVAKRRAILHETNHAIRSVNALEGYDDLSWRPPSAAQRASVRAILRTKGFE